MSEEGKVCQVSVNRGTSRWSHYAPCGKPAKGIGIDGKPKCGVHLAQDRRRQEAEEAYVDTAALGLKLAKETDRMSRKLGVSVKPYYNPYMRVAGQRGTGGYTGEFVVDGDWLRELAKGKKV